MSNNSQILHCHTAKHKLAEAKFFLDLIKSKEIWDDEDHPAFYLNAFVSSANSVTEYVQSDFIFHTIRNPRIKWRDYENRDSKKKKIQEHPNSKIIQDFLSRHKNEWSKMPEDPMINYFHNKRNEIMHVSWSGPRAASFTEDNDGNVDYRKRHLESGFTLDMMWNDQNYRNELFDISIKRQDQMVMVHRLCEESLIKICEEFLGKLNDFIAKFDRKDFFKTC